MLWNHLVWTKHKIVPRTDKQNGILGGYSSSLQTKSSVWSFNSRRGEGGYSRWSYPKFLSPPWEVPIRDGRGYSGVQKGGIMGFLTTFFSHQLPTSKCFCITDRLSHTTWLLVGRLTSFAVSLQFCVLFGSCGRLKWTCAESVNCTSLLLLNGYCFKSRWNKKLNVLSQFAHNSTTILVSFT